MLAYINYTTKMYNKFIFLEYSKEINNLKTHETNIFLEI